MRRTRLCRFVKVPCSLIICFVHFWKIAVSEPSCVPIIDFEMPLFNCYFFKNIFSFYYFISVYVKWDSLCVFNAACLESASAASFTRMPTLGQTQLILNLLFDFFRICFTVYNILLILDGLLSASIVNLQSQRMLVWFCGAPFGCFQFSHQFGFVNAVRLPQWY